jgi:hypothetical protein
MAACFCSGVCSGDPLSAAHPQAKLKAKKPKADRTVKKDRQNSEQLFISQSSLFNSRSSFHFPSAAYSTV